MSCNSDKEKAEALCLNSKITNIPEKIVRVVMTPLEKYNQDLEINGFQKDPAQAQAIQALNDLYTRLQTQPTLEQSKHNVWGKVTQLFSKPKVELITPLQGLYFWGGVGRGKTYMMDIFFDALPTERKMRVHFHRFMYRVHDELAKHQDVSDPLELVADTFKQETDIICFDEFFVSDITDAMILATLLQALFARGITLVATSNIPPPELYRNGLQRARFLPAITLIEKHCTVMNIDSGIDYRLRTLEQAEIYHYPLDEQACLNMQRYFEQLAGEGEGAGEIEINHRAIQVINSCNGVLRISFEELCQSARSQNDYIELSKIYHTVLMQDVVQMSRETDDAARRFIALVDEFYERKVKLIISAEVAMENLYVDGLLNFEFKRCQSRLIEMQSHAYLAEEHLG
jgi:cell division protein ZapE